MDNFCTLRKVFSRLLRKVYDINKSNKEKKFFILKNLGLSGSGLDPDSGSGSRFSKITRSGSELSEYRSETLIDS